MIFAFKLSESKEFNSRKTYEGNANHLFDWFQQVFAYLELVKSFKRTLREKIN